MRARLRSTTAPDHVTWESERRLEGVRAVVRSGAAILLGVVTLAGCGSAIVPGDSDAASSSASTTPLATPMTTLPGSPNNTAALIEAFRATVADPAFAGSGTIAGTESGPGQLAPRDIAGSVAWHGEDVTQSIRKTVKGRHVGASDATTVDGRTYLFSCAPPGCLALIDALWTAVPDDAPGPYSIIELLRSGLELRSDGPSTVNGRALERLVAPLTADEAPALGMVGSFGQRSFQEGLEGVLAILVEPSGLPVRIEVETMLDQFGQVTETSMVFDLTDRPGSPPAAPPLPQTLAYVVTEHAYRIAVPMDWRHVPGTDGGVDRFVAPKGAPRQQLRIRLELIPLKEFNSGVADGDLGRRLAAEYDGRGIGGYGGFMGAINLTAVSLEADIDGKPTIIDAGPIFWSGPCPDGGTTCSQYWSIMELWSDEAAWSEPPGPSAGITLFKLAATFRNDVPAID